MMAVLDVMKRVRAMNDTSTIIISRATLGFRMMMEKVIGVMRLVKAMRDARTVNTSRTTLSSRMMMDTLIAVMRGPVTHGKVIAATVNVTRHGWMNLGFSMTM